MPKLLHFKRHSCSLMVHWIKLFGLFFVINGVCFYLYHDLYTNSVTSRTCASPLLKYNPIINFTGNSLALMQHLQKLGKNETFHYFGNGSIPRIVHYTYKSYLVPTQYEEFVRHCVALNPDVLFLLWTDSSAEEFLKMLITTGEKNASQFLTVLKSYHGIEKADVLRLVILYYLGGVYMDLDMECRKPLAQGLDALARGNRTRQRVTCWLDQEQTIQTRIMWNREYSAMNNLMICRPRHPFFLYLLRNTPMDDKQGFSMDKTGPFMFTKRFEEYSTSWKLFSKNMNNYVELANPDWFSSLVDNLEWQSFKCGRKEQMHRLPVWTRIACWTQMEDFKQSMRERDQSAILVHRFLHLGYSFSSLWVGDTFSICQYSVYLLQF